MTVQQLIDKLQLQKNPDLEVLIDTLEGIYKIDRVLFGPFFGDLGRTGVIYLEGESV